MHASLLCRWFLYLRTEVAEEVIHSFKPSDAVVVCRPFLWTWKMCV